jgi:hypothetical protein
MKNLLSARAAAQGLRTILSFVVLFHLLVLTGVIPYGIVWGGRLQSREQMLSFEAVSIGLNLLMLAVVAVAAGRLRLRVPPRLIQGLLWLMAGLFALNTVGNLLATTTLERLLFTPLTLLLAVCSLRLALSPAGAAAPAGTSA